MSFSAALLAGGRSSRMGRDKAFLEIDGVPLWQRQVQILRTLRPSEVFVCGPARNEWIEAGLEIVPDAVYGAGPLAALVAALRRCTTPHLLVLAVDLPNMTTPLLERLLSFCDQSHGVISKRGDHFEPLVAVYSVACLRLAEKLLGGTTSVSSQDGTERIPPKTSSMQELANCAVNEKLLIPMPISADDEPLFFNLNTPQDLLLSERSSARMKESTP